MSTPEDPGGPSIIEEKRQNVPQMLQNLRQHIWSRRPILGEIMGKHGNQTLYKYAQDFRDVNKAPGLDHRKPELINVLAELVERRLGKEAAERVKKQLGKLPVVSTADHHAPVQHPFFLNSNIITALTYLEQMDPDINSLIVFSFASISINNLDGYPRGLLFHGQERGSGDLIKLPILPDKEKMGVVYGMRPFNILDLDRARSELARRERNNEVTKERAAAVEKLLAEYYGAPDVLAAPDLNSQITKLTHRYWPKFFSAKQVVMPELLYIEIETLVTELLLRHHLNDTSSLIHKFLFNEEFAKHIPKLFNNIPGAFSEENGWGTYLFWAIDDKQHRVRMFLSEGELHSTFRRHTCKMSPEGLNEALRTKQIFPSMALCYIIVALYYGIKCLGGFCQVNDLTKTKLAWQELMRTVGLNEEAEAVVPIQTKELGGDGMTLSYLHTTDGKIVPATGVDLLIDPPQTTFEDLVELSKRVTLEEIMNPMLPDIYRVLYAQNDRDPALAALNAGHIVNEAPLRAKIIKAHGWPVDNI